MSRQIGKALLKTGRYGIVIFAGLSVFTSSQSLLAEVVDSQGDTGYGASVAVDKNGNPHISYCDRTSNYVKYAYNNGTNWQLRSLYQCDPTAWWTSIALSSNGAPHVVFPYQGRIAYAYRNGSSWPAQPEAVSPDNIALGGGLSVALDSTGMPQVCFVRQESNGSGSLQFARRNGASWSQENVGAAMGYQVAVCVDRTNTIHVTWGSPTGIAYARRTASGWSSEVVANNYTQSKPSGHDYITETHVFGYANSVAVDNSGRPHIVFSENVTVRGQQRISYSRLIYAYRATDGWHMTKDYDASTVAADLSVSIEVDTNNLPHVCCYDATSGLLKLVWKDSKEWWNVSNLDSDATGSFITCSLGLDPRNVSRGINKIAYQYHSMTSAGDLRYITDNNIVISGTPQAVDPSPPHGAINQPDNTMLAWYCMPRAISSSDVYFGTNSELGVMDYKGNQTNSWFNPGPLSANTVYYWRIDTHGNNVATGDVWAFSTAADNLPDQGSAFLVTNNVFPGTSCYVLESLTPCGSLLFFFAHDITGESAIWRTDGTASGTFRIQGIDLSNWYLWPEFAAVGSFICVYCQYDSRAELWKCDGTSSEAVLLRSWATTNGYPCVAPMGTQLYFMVHGPNGDQELWKSDGTSNGTVIVHSIRPDPIFNDPNHLTAVGSNLFFIANSGTYGNELWISGGTSNSTVMVRDIHPGESSSNPSWYTAVGSNLFFTADNGTNGRELWKSDGTSNGTVMVRDIRPGVNSSHPELLTAVGSNLFFTAVDGMNGRELWKSDGTSNGTVMVRDIRLGVSSSNPGWLTAAGSVCYFCGFDDERGDELWKSDGTRDGTLRVRDIYYGEVNSYPDYITAVGSRVFFSADDGIRGDELWTSRGSAVDTELVADIIPGAIGSVPRSLTKAGQYLYFISDDDGGGGPALWALPLLFGPRISAVSAGPPAAITFPCDTDLLYSLQTRSLLTTGAWQEVQGRTSVAGTPNGTMTLDDNIMVSETQRFYRIVVEMQ